MGAFSHGARTAPFITVFTPVTAEFDGLLPRSSGGGEGLRVEGGGESALGMAKEIDSTLHCRFTTFTASWKYSKWSKPSGANPTTVAGTRIPLERV